MASSKEAKRKYAREQERRTRQREPAASFRAHGFLTLEEHCQTNKVIDTVIGCRVSSEGQDEIVQMKGMKDRIQRMGVKVAAEFSGVENGKRLDKRARKSLYQALDAAAKTESKLLTYFGPTRLVRAKEFHPATNYEAVASDEQIAEVQRLASRKGVAIVFLVDPDISPEDEESELQRLAAEVRHRKCLTKKEQKIGVKTATTSLMFQLRKARPDKPYTMREISHKIREIMGVSVSYSTVSRRLRSK